jgi:hypothetical protein
MYESGVRDASRWSLQQPGNELKAAKHTASARYKFIRGIKLQAPGNEQKAATRTASARYKFIRGMSSFATKKM